MTRWSIDCSPMSACLRFARVRAKRPAPTSSRKESATCAATNAFLSRADRSVPATAPASSLRLATEIEACRLQRRRNAEQQAGDESGRDTEQQHTQVGVGVQQQGRAVRGQHGEQCARGHCGERQSEHRAGDGQHQAFDKELTDEGPAARANRQAHGDFLLSGDSARDEEAGHVRAGDQEDDRGHAHQHRQRHRVLLAQARVPGGRTLDDDRPLQELLAVVGGLPADLRVGGLCHEQLMEQRLQRRGRRLHGVPSLQPPEDLHELVVRIVEAVLLRRDQRLHSHRQPEIGRLGGIDAVEPRVRDPDDLHRMAIHQHFGADDIASSAEPSGPVAMTQDDDRVPAIDGVVRRAREEASCSRADAKRLEVVARNELGSRRFGVLADRKRDRR